MPTVQFGLDRLLADATLRRPLAGKRVALLAHPVQQRLRRLWLYDIADDVGVEKITRHRSTLRPSLRGRLKSIRTWCEGVRNFVREAYDVK